MSEPSSNPCLPPVPEFSWSPLIPHLGEVATFNASQSLPGPGLGTTISKYSWDWGEVAVPTQSTLNSTQHLFSHECSCHVTLTITDSNGIIWSVTKIVTVINVLVDLKTEDIYSRPQDHLVIPGSLITITAIVRNSGTSPQNATIRINRESVTMAQQTILIKPQGSATLNATWDTTNFRPRVYRFDGYVLPVTNETETSNNLKSTWVQLIEPFSAGVAPGLLASTGIAILVLVGATFSISYVRKRRRPLD